MMFSRKKSKFVKVYTEGDTEDVTHWSSCDERLQGKEGESNWRISGVVMSALFVL